MEAFRLPFRPTGAADSALDHRDSEKSRTTASESTSWPDLRARPAHDLERGKGKPDRLPGWHARIARLGADDLGRQHRTPAPMNEPILIAHQ